MTSEALEAAKQAVAVRDWATARRILAPLVAADPYGLPVFFLARAELELGRPDVAALLVNAFRASRPRHVGSAVLAARIHLAAGDLDQAEQLARDALALEPGSEGTQRLLERITAAGVARELSGPLAVVDARHLEARTGDPSPELLRAAQELAAVEPGPDWVHDTAQAKVAYFHHARDLGVALRSYDPELIDVATRFDYVSWPRRIQEHLGGSVLDVGCGSGGLGIGYLVAGATSYTGIDPLVDLDSRRARNKRTRQWDDLSLTPRQIEARIPAVRIVRSEVENYDFGSTFDTIVLHNVSEHVPDLDRVLACLTPLCGPGSKIVFLHHNFYSWNGHKRQPGSPGRLDENDPSHQLVYDWRHVTAAPPGAAGHAEAFGNLNRLRLDELRTAIAGHLDIVRWEEVPSDAATRARLSPTVLDRVTAAVPDITERDLLVNNVFCVAGPRA